LNGLPLSEALTDQRIAGDDAGRFQTLVERLFRVEILYTSRKNKRGFTQLII
jgi:hypothetical protein